MRLVGRPRGGRDIGTRPKGDRTRPVVRRPDLGRPDGRAPRGPGGAAGGPGVDGRAAGRGGVDRVVPVSTQRGGDVGGEGRVRRGEDGRAQAAQGGGRDRPGVGDRAVGPGEVPGGTGEGGQAGTGEGAAYLAAAAVGLRGGAGSGRPPEPLGAVQLLQRLPAPVKAPEAGGHRELVAVQAEAGPLLLPAVQEAPA